MNEFTRYVCVMFPYPSSNGLHIGHWYNYAIVDSLCRWYNYRGIETFQPFGYDAFGLPAENYARKIGGDPRDVTYENIANFRSEMERMNTLYEEKLITSDDSYVKWTQWLFLKLKEHGLAYKAVADVNWCPSCETSLANEQVENDKCERCGSAIETRQIPSWFFRITLYKQRLLDGLEGLDFPESTKRQQRHWIENLRDWNVSRQRSWGCPIPVEGETDTLDTFVDSSFYYLRYLMDENSEEFLTPEAYHPVDLYVGGNEHATAHLIYARFIHHFLYDIGVVPTPEPFQKLVHQGMITNQGIKMSKSKGNVVDPKQYDPDELRLYLMFIGPYEDGGSWNDKGMIGIHKMIKRYKTWLGRAVDDGEDIDLKPLEEQIDYNVRSLKVNKIVSDLMIFYNGHKDKIVSTKTRDELMRIIRCFAPGFVL